MVRDMKGSFLFGRAVYGTSILLLLFSSGCSMYRSKSECPLRSPISCQPTSKINKLIDGNVLEGFIERLNCKGRACMMWRL